MVFRPFFRLFRLTENRPVLPLARASALAAAGIGLAGLVTGAAANQAANPVPDQASNQAGTAEPAAATQVLIEDSVFVVTLDNDPETEKAYSYQSNQVPFLPGQSCYGWRLRLSDAGKVVSFREVLTLPSDPAYWPHEPSEFDTTARFTDRTTTVTERYIAPEEGWIGNGWCVLEGDPKGAYSVEVSVNGHFARRFDFEVGDTLDPEKR